MIGFIVKRVYENFVEKSVDECLMRCRDDLTALTRFVTWDLHERSAGALRRSLPDSSMVQIYSLAVSSSACTYTYSIRIIYTSNVRYEDAFGFAVYDYVMPNMSE